MNADEKAKAEAYERANAIDRSDLRAAAKDTEIQYVYDLIERCENRGYRYVNDRILKELSAIDKTIGKLKDIR